MSEERKSGRVGRTITRILAVIGGFSVVMFLLLLLIPIVFSGPARVPGRVILELDLTNGVVEATPADPLGMLIGMNQLSVRDVIDALRRGAEDDRVVGLVAHVGGAGIALAHAEELRGAVEEFRRSGKPAIAFSESFGEFGGGNVGYYLATGFDEIHLQPSGSVGLTGLIAEAPFAARALEMLGVEPQIAHRYEYKDAVNLFTEEEMPEPQEEALTRILESMQESLVAGISAGRALDPELVEELLAGGPYFGEEALVIGLVDELNYRDEVFEGLRDRVDGGEFLFASRYLSRAGRPHTRGPQIALIHGVGTIMPGSNEVNPFAGGTVMGSETITRAFRDAVESDDVRAIVFRVDSPGGSYIASDAIWRETIRAREAGKPVIVSMGSVAASGGYFVAMGADRIVAQPSTITGSIGVYAGKMVMSGLSEQLGIVWDEIETAENASMWSPFQPFSEGEWERLNSGLDRIYSDFTSKAATGRGLSPDSVHTIARGRIWTGSDAMRLGLVDELGGLETALAHAREAAGLEPDARITLREFPRPRSLVEMVFDPGRSSSYPTFSRLAAFVRVVDGLAAELSGLHLSDGANVRMPAVPRVR